MMGGEIDAEGAAGKGSTFKVQVLSVHRSLGSNESWRPLRRRVAGPNSGPLPTFKG